MAASMMLFTRDLRLADNPALGAAVAAAPAAVPLFVLDDDLLARWTAPANRLSFLHDSLRDLDAGLREAGAALIVRRGPWAATVIETARQAGVSTIHVADDVSGYAQARLAALESAAASERMKVIRHPGVTVVEPGGGSARRRGRIPGVHALLSPLAGGPAAAAGGPAGRDHAGGRHRVRPSAGPGPAHVGPSGAQCPGGR
jgi:deoxyribodipyrimidine photolyase